MIESKSGYSRWAALLSRGLVITPKRQGKATGEIDAKSKRFIEAIAYKSGHVPGSFGGVGGSGGGGSCAKLGNFRVCAQLEERRLVEAIAGYAGCAAYC